MFLISFFKSSNEVNNFVLSSSTLAGATHFNSSISHNFSLYSSSNFSEVVYIYDLPFTLNSSIKIFHFSL
jgi:hypothetical protein